MKPLAKKLLLLFFRIAVFPLVALYKFCSFSGPQEAFFCSLGQFLSLFPGKTGSYLRVAFYSDTLHSVSPNCHIDFGSYFPHPDVIIHEGVYIGAFCIIGKCEIGKDTLVGSFVNILSGNRQHNFTNISRPIQAQGGRFVRITIGSNCWLGNNAIVMTDIGNRTVIGAGSVVAKAIPEYSVAVGNPCKVIKDLRAAKT
ncbi:MAG: acyltransferase [Thermodesulfobacteriota bacterium]